MRTTKFLKGEKMYKGHRIEIFNSLMQIFYVVDGNLKNAYWSMEDAKRAINGQPLKFEPVDITNVTRYEE